MANLTQHIEEILDRLFNLKGEDNVIIGEITTEIEATVASINATADEQSANEIKKNNSEGRLAVFKNQKETFENAFSGLDDETFAALRDIDVNVEIGTMLQQISERAPQFCQELSTEIEGYKSAIDSNIERKKELSEKLADLEQRKAISEGHRERLISLIEQSLSNDDIERESLTTNYVKKILSLFDTFTTDEINQLTKLIIFPDEGLYEYAAHYEERLAAGEVNVQTDKVVEEPVPEETPEIEEEKVTEVKPADEMDGEPKDLEEPTEEPATITIDGAEMVSSEDVKADPSVCDTATIIESTAKATELYEGTDEPIEDINLAQTAIIGLDGLNSLNGGGEETASKEQITSDDTIVLSPQEVKMEEVPTIPERKENIEEYLQSLGLNLDKFAELNNGESKEIFTILSRISHKIIEENYEILRSININPDVIYKKRFGNIFLADVDLSKKITLLRAKGISENKIAELLEESCGGLRKSFSTLESEIAIIEQFERKVTDENIGLLKYNLTLFEDNYNKLVENGFELEEKEIRNNKIILCESLNIDDDVEILKNYLISIVRKNGKYALGVFWKKPLTLLQDIDELVEADLENLIASNPELLAQTTTPLVRRIKFCEQRGEAIYEGNDRTSFCDYIVHYQKFNAKFGDAQLPIIPTREETNKLIPSIIGNEDYVDIIVNTLDSYYSNVPSFKDIELDEETNAVFEDLKHQVVETLGAQPTGKYTYRIGDVFICKNKVERHIRIILDALAKSGQSPEGVEKEILLASVLYNLRQDEETLRKLASECLGFNQDETLGGKAL